MSDDFLTPCIKVCVVDGVSNLCFGCGRTLPEIARWGRMTNPERVAIMAELPARMAQHNLKVPGTSA